MVATKSSEDVLAIVVPHYGQATETFIRRYCNDLLPQRAVLIHFFEGQGAWSIDGPVFNLPKATCGTNTSWKIFRGFQKMFGVERLFGDPYSGRLLSNFLIRHRVTTVFSQYLIAGWNVHPVVKSLGLRHVIRGHGFDLSNCLDQSIWRSRYLELSDADAIVVPSPFQVNRLKLAGIANANIQSIPYGIDLPEVGKLHTHSKSDESDLINVLAAGRMVAKKAPLKLIQAFLKASDEIPELRLDLIGGGPLEQEVRDYLSNSKSGDKVRLLGQKTHMEVLEAMQSADIFMQHSITDPETGDQEGAPVAILEAMGHGIPIVSTKHSGIPYLVGDGECGLLSDEGDTEEMAISLLRLAKSPDLRTQMGNNGRRRSKTMTWEQERKALIELLFPNTP